MPAGLRALGQRKTTGVRAVAVALAGSSQGLVRSIETSASITPADSMPRSL